MEDAGQSNCLCTLFYRQSSIFVARSSVPILVEFPILESGLQFRRNVRGGHPFAHRSQAAHSGQDVTAN